MISANPSHEVIVLQPNDIPEKFKHHTWEKATDWLRLHMLYQHGGVWLDASCICIENVETWIHPHADVTAFQSYYGCIDTYAIAAKPKSKLIYAWLTELEHAMNDPQAYIQKYQHLAKNAHIIWPHKQTYTIQNKLPYLYPYLASNVALIKTKYSGYSGHNSFDSIPSNSGHNSPTHSGFDSNPSNPNYSGHNEIPSNPSNPSNIHLKKAYYQGGTLCFNTHNLFNQYPQTYIIKLDKIDRKIAQHQLFNYINTPTYSAYNEIPNYSEYNEIPSNSGHNSSTHNYSGYNEIPTNSITKKQKIHQTLNLIPKKIHKYQTRYKYTSYSGSNSILISKITND